MRLHNIGRFVALYAGFLFIGGHCEAKDAVKEPSLSSGIDSAGFDTSVKPGDDFFQYVNGGWIKNNPIPAEYSRWGAFSKLRDDNLVILRDIVDGLSKKNDPLDGQRAKVARFLRDRDGRSEAQQAGRYAAGRRI